jgi:hypothetical protein
VGALGWVREMWGYVTRSNPHLCRTCASCGCRYRYAIAAASLGIKHRVMDAFQFEGGSIGNRDRRGT